VSYIYKSSKSASKKKRTFKDLLSFSPCPCLLFLTGFSSNKSEETAANAKDGGLPEPIERKCQEWERILQCEVEEKRKTLYSEQAGFKLGFRNFLNGTNISKLYLHTEQVRFEWHL
jgi:hypothetical protein